MPGKGLYEGFPADALQDFHISLGNFRDTYLLHDLMNWVFHYLLSVTKLQCRLMLKNAKLGDNDAKKALIKP